ncbi:ceramide-1-phosphate transfer protein-like [Lacerta agilis]|uniref:ceramide-1-phosphate transfer protein-like n=1 Tax=Lacerta agilis TaxID=80427 RepID=UPI00141A1767|nr:ceramide-1-phosphate transfer protein-like [Lacerta agilis]
MGVTGWAPTRLCRLACLVGIFLLLLLLCFSSLRLQLPSSTCIWGVRPCRWIGGVPPSKEDAERKPPPSASPPSAATGAALLPQTPSKPQDLGEGFQVGRLQRAFADSLTPSGQILIREYLSGWKELVKFMDSLGAAFGLISGETRTKMAILQENQRGPHGAHYRTVQSMVRFELARGLVGFQSLPAGRPPSGCRTFLRLHRALKWLELFLLKLGTSPEDADPSRMCADAYQEALAPYHSWWVRQAAALAFLAMPSQRELYRILNAGGGDEDKGLRRLLDTVHSIAHVYNATQELYAAHGMLALP